MSELKKISKPVGEKEPIVAYYQFKKPEVDHPKVRVLAKGQEIAGIYEHTFMDEEYKNADGSKKAQSHVIKTAEGKVTVKACQSIDKAFAEAGVTRGTQVKLVYLGLGKKATGKKPPFLFDVFAATNAAQAPKAAVVKEEEAPEVDAEDDSNAMPF